MNILNEAKKIEQEVIEWRRHLHENPEVGFDLDNTIDFVCKKLDEMGVSYDRNIAKSAVIAEIKGKSGGKTISLRADMDALPVKEETGLEFASKNNCMHACGHDSHTAMLLGACKLINGFKDELKGNVKFIFQPAEELGVGSVDIIDKGVLDDVDEILAVHVGNLTTEGKKSGELFFSEGSMMACMDKFQITVKGKGAHGAYPAESIDPIVIASNIVMALQEIVSREILPTRPAVVSVCQFHAGTAFNIIPGEVKLEGTVRAVTNEDRDIIAKRIGEIAEGIAKSYRGEVVYDFFWQPPPLVNDPEVARKIKKTAEKLFPEDVRDLKDPVMPGEDFAWYLEKVPGSFVFLFNPMEIDGQKWAHHNSRFAIDEAQFIKGYSLFAQYVYDELS